MNDIKKRKCILCGTILFQGSKYCGPCGDEMLVQKEKNRKRKYNQKRKLRSVM